MYLQVICRSDVFQQCREVSGDDQADAETGHIYTQDKAESSMMFRPSNHITQRSTLPYIAY